jgi:hypothetical protein
MGNEDIQEHLETENVIYEMGQYQRIWKEHVIRMTPGKHTVTVLGRCVLGWPRKRWKE